MDMQVLQHREDKFLFDMKALMATAEQERRGFTDDERKQYADWERGLADVSKRIERLKGDESMLAAIDNLAGGPPPSRTRRDGRFVISRAAVLKSAGQYFVESEAFAWLAKTKATRSGTWTSDSVEVPRAALRLATLTEDPASGGAVVVPDYQGTIQPGPTLPVVVADLLAQGTTGSNTVPVMVEMTFTNNAAPVAEGGTKPESALTFELQTEPVRKIAHWIPVSEELLEDAPAVASYIDTRLRYGVLRVEDQQLLFGTGTAPQLEGILSRTGLAADVARIDPDTNADAILAQIVAIESATGLPVSGVVMNPLAWASITGAKLETGEYLSGGPFGSPTTPMIWNRQVALTDQITATTALVGAFRTGAQIFRHGGVRVNSTNAHADFFTKNLVAIRAEERLALAVYRPSAFGKVTGLTTA